MDYRYHDDAPEAPAARSVPLRRRVGEILVAGLAALGLAAAAHAFGMGDVKAAALPCALAGLLSLALRGPLLCRGEDAGATASFQG